MSRYMINDLETEAMRGLRYGARALYAVIRERMDYRTGEVGRKVLISRWTLQEGLYIEPMRGRATKESGAPSPKTVIGYEEELQRAGLIEYRTVLSQKQLIFFLPLATKLEVRLGEEGHVSDEEGQQTSGSNQTQSGQGFDESTSGELGQGKNGELGQTSGSGNYSGKPLCSKQSSSQTLGSNDAVDNSMMASDGLKLITRPGDWVPFMLSLGLAESVVCSEGAAKIYRRWVIEGVLPEEVIEARNGAGSVAMTPQYLAKVVNTRRAMQGNRGADGRMQPALDWTGSWLGIVDRGAELGVVQGDGEEPWVFKMRVFAKAGVPMPAVH